MTLARLLEPQWGSSVPNTLVPPAPDFEVFPLAATEQSLAARFEQQAQRWATRLALKDDAQTLTYAELNRRANQVAHRIVTHCPAEIATIGLHLSSGALVAIALLGVLKAGRAFVFLDPGQPAARLAYIVEDAQITCVVTARGSDPRATPLPWAVQHLIDLDDLTAGDPTENLELPLSPDTLACLLYTSGSTGQPKGVMHTQRTLLHDAMRRINALGMSSTDRLAQFAAGTAQALGVALSALLSGAALYPWDVKRAGISHLASWLRQEALTIYYSAVPLFRQFAATLTGHETFPALRLIRLASDTVYPTDVALYQQHFAPPCLLMNGLSSSEAFTTCLYALDHATPVPESVVPVGYPVAGIHILLLDDAGQPVSPGEVGEIVVQSAFLSPGYWQKPDLTAATFRPDPTDGSARLYYTGDVGRLHPDGCLEHLGRKRFRVKVRGYSVETPEVEAALRGLANVQEAVVIPRETSTGETDLLAYVVPTTAPAPSPLALHQAMRQVVPDYMVPAVFIVLEALPMTPNGKVDRLALPAPESVVEVAPPPEALPRTPLETQLVQLWSDLLGVATLGIHDDFFAYGGHSLLAMQMLVRVRELRHIEIPLATLVAVPTIAALAQAIEAPDGVVTPPVLLAYKPYGSKPPFFCVHGVELLARHMDPEQPFYALHPHALDGRRAPSTVEAMAADYLQAIQTRQPTGPYYLGGYSFGGLVAFEMAQQLRRQGHTIALLVLLDSGGPEEGSDAQGTWWTRLKEYGYEGFARLCALYVRAGRPVPLAWRLPYFLGTCHNARRTYKPVVYPGRVHLLRARNNPRDPLQRWGGLSQEGLVITEIPGDHFTMLQEPQVHEVAMRLQEVLHAAYRA